jgi:hypothetical protein
MDVATAPGGARRWLLALSALLAIVASLAVAPSAQAAFGLSGLSAQPTDTSAGAHSDFVIKLNFSSDDFVKDLTIHLPPGQVGDPLATPLCTVAQLNANSCPPNTQVGRVHTVVTIASSITQPVDGKIFNLTPQPGEPARFGIVLTPSVGSPIILQSAVKLRPTDFGLDSILNNIPNSAMGLSTHIDSMTVTLLGNPPGAAKPFSRNPTSCTPATTTFDAASYGGATASGSAAYTPTNCSALDFSPTFTAKIGESGKTSAGSSPPLTTIVDQDPGEAGAEEVDAILPHGIGADAAQLGRQCQVAAFEAGTCPASTVVGDATAVSPFQSQPLSGPVVIVTPAPGGALPRLGLDLQGPLHIQLFGSFTLSSAGPGNSFVGVPDIPLSHFVLNFAANRLVTTSRDLCTGTAPTFATNFIGWNGATQTGDVAAKVQGCGGGGGGGVKPKAKIAVSHASSKKPRLKLKVKAGSAKIKQTKLTLPKKLRFASSRKALKRGLSVKGTRNAVANVKRGSLKLKTKPTSKLVERAAHGALRRKGKLAHRKVHFKLAVTDKSGKTTHLKLATKAKP